ncbi:dihydrofolate reductase [Parasteatoda tepidariorum]|uniref:dihydrofolate reductase n=1 Tax=Parasteatoda tepidariorum TaxID=114398 RepID=UPI0039BC97E8
MRRFKMTLHIVAAACENNGIGSNGQLPWRLKKEMAFFKELTSSVLTPEKKNAVIMGRKTWFSIPEKMRPLANRINIVLTTTQLDLKGPDYVTDSFDKAMDWLNTSAVKEKLEKVFVIGGEAVYKVAMDSDHHQIIYLTRIHEKFHCDTYFPKMDDSFQLTEEFEPDFFSNHDHLNYFKNVQEENGIKYKHEVYIKKDKK